MEDKNTRIGLFILTAYVILYIVQIALLIAKRSSVELSDRLVMVPMVVMGLIPAAVVAVGKFKRWW